MMEELTHAGQVGVNFFRLFLHFMKRPTQAPEHRGLEHLEMAEQEKIN